MIAEVLVEIKAKNIDKTFSYLIPKDFKEKIKVGIRVLVPFGKQKLEGFVLKIKENEKLDYELKEIISLIDEEPVLNQEMLEQQNGLKQTNGYVKKLLKTSSHSRAFVNSGLLALLISVVAIIVAIALLKI